MFAFTESPQKIKKKRRQYSTEALANAFQAVNKCKMSVYRAAREYGVPETTIRDRQLGNVDASNAKVGPKPVFNQVTERKLVDHIIYMNSIGYGYSKSDVQLLATDYAIFMGQRKITDPILSDRWFYGLLNRFPNLCVRKPQKLSMKRAECASKEQLAEYFKELGTIMSQNGLHQKPELIYNIDETGLQTEHNPPKVVGDKNHSAKSVTSPREKLVTVIGCGNAIGQALPPYYIFPGKRFNPDLMHGTPSGSGGECSQSGWSNSSTFMNYLKTHFLKYANVGKDLSPTLILYDGHKSHVSLTLTEWAKTHNIVLFVLPPHCSHILQPLDIGCFGPFKKMYHKECQNYLRQNPGIKITKFIIGKLSNAPYCKGLSQQNLSSAFLKTGIYPFNSKVVNPSVLAPSCIYKNCCEDDTEKPVEVIAVDSTKENGASSVTLNENDVNVPVPVSVNLSVDSSCRIESFFENKTIRSVKTTEKNGKKRKNETISGNLQKKKNKVILTNKSKTAFQPPFKTAPNMSNTTQCLNVFDESTVNNSCILSNKIENDSSGKVNCVKTKEKQTKEPCPSTSGISANKGGPLTLDTASEDYSSDDDEGEPCCICKKQPRCTASCCKSHHCKMGSV